MSIKKSIIINFLFYYIFITFDKFKILMSSKLGSVQPHEPLEIEQDSNNPKYKRQASDRVAAEGARRKSVKLFDGSF